MGAAALLCLLAFLSLRYLRSKPEPELRQYFTPPVEKSAEALDTRETATSEKLAEPEEYESPVDFEGLWEVNEDIYAWLYIPYTDISYPLLQSPDDDSYYLRRSMERRYDENGVLFTEASYNGTDMTDPVTIVYGHNMKNGLMFSDLQSSYSSAEKLAEHSEIIVYLPDRELHYAVFAAIPFDNRHILCNYDFTNKRIFRLFLNEILSVRALEASFAEDTPVGTDDRVLILSTCLQGNRSNRFLVCAKLDETIPTRFVK